MTPAEIEVLATAFDEGFLAIGAAILVIEIAKGFFTKSLRGRGYLDMAVSISTQIPVIAFEIFVASIGYAGSLANAVRFAFAKPGSPLVMPQSAARAKKTPEPSTP